MMDFFPPLLRSKKMRNTLRCRLLDGCPLTDSGQRTKTMAFCFSKIYTGRQERRSYDDSDKRKQKNIVCGCIAHGDSFHGSLRGDGTTGKPRQARRWKLPAFRRRMRTRRSPRARPFWCVPMQMRKRAARSCWKGPSP